VINQLLKISFKALKDSEKAMLIKINFAKLKCKPKIGKAQLDNK